MNRLKDLGAYLCGPIDFEEDAGRAWRDMMTEFLEPMKVKVFNPLKPLFYGAEEFEDVRRPQLQEMRQKGRFRELRKAIKDINHWDLRKVDLSSCLIVNYDIRVRMCGTYEELFKANTQVKPVLLMVGPDRKEIAKWMYGRFPAAHMFTSWGKMKKYLESINEDPYHKFSKADRKRWLFFDGPHMH